MLTQRRETNVLAKKTNKQTNTLTPTHLQSQIRKANVKNVATVDEQGEIKGNTEQSAS